MNVREAKMDSIGEKLDLLGVGTRYDHYMELKEVFMLGIEIIDKMLPAHRSLSDMTTQTKLKNAVEVIEKRLNYLSDFDNKIFAVGKEVRAAGVHRPLLLPGGSHDKPQKDINQPSNPENTGCTSDERRPIKGGWPEV